MDKKWFEQLLKALLISFFLTVLDVLYFFLAHISQAEVLMKILGSDFWQSSISPVFAGGGAF